MAPMDPDILNRACWVRGQAAQDLQRALDLCSQAVALAPDAFAFIDSRAFVQFRLGDLDKALADVNAALALNPDAPEPRFMRGVIKLRQGRDADGKADLAAARRARPSIDEEYASYGVTP